MNTIRVAILLAGIAIDHAAAMNDSQLNNILQQRLNGDRTDTCVAAAVIDKDAVARAFACANPLQPLADVQVKTAALELSPAQLADYAGEYPLLSGFAVTISSRNGKLFVQGTGQPAIKVTPVRPDVFLAAAVGAEFRFERDAAGAVTALTLLQSGQQLRGVRH
jgi:hypothetical protein